ncbi:MAG: T9SS type A sorting domain-containing protein [Hymenobacteraceae bacterium]|nr:T9SS type A sorting domain-containing protein [Hymenobacteraceae bacterium]
MDQTLDGVVPDLTLYNGGASDGFATALLPERALDGLTHEPTLFFGGHGDGWSTSASKDQTLDGDQQQLVLFMGGASDGWAMYTSQSQSLDGAQEELVLFRGGAGDGAYAMHPDEPLPVELMLFRATRTGDGQVKLQWATASENDNLGFEVWRMDEGESRFRKIGFLEGQGNSNTTIHYTYHDPNTNTGTSYYRLKQLDTDGSFSYSKVIAVAGAMKVPQRPTAWPIPVRDVLTVQASAPEVSAALQLYSSSGRLLLEKRFTGKTELNLHKLSQGLYLLHVKEAPSNAETVIKVIVSN